MKKIFLAAGVLAMAIAGVSSARAGVRISIGLPVPVFYAAPRPVFVQPAPVVVAPAPVVVAPAPVVVASAPVVAVPAPVVVARPVVVAPAPVYCAPVVRFGFYGPRGHFHRFYRHGCW